MTAKTLQRSENSDNKGGLASESLAGLGIAFDPEHSSAYSQRLSDGFAVEASHKQEPFRPAAPSEKEATEVPSGSKVFIDFSAEYSIDRSFIN